MGSIFYILLQKNKLVDRLKDKLIPNLKVKISTLVQCLVLVCPHRKCKCFIILYFAILSFCRNKGNYDHTFCNGTKYLGNLTSKNCRPIINCTCSVEKKLGEQEFVRLLGKPGWLSANNLIL